MAKESMKVTGTVTEVRIIDGTHVIVFVKVRCPLNIKDKAVRYDITLYNSATCYIGWVKLSVNDVVRITRTYDSAKSSIPLYELEVIRSEIIDGNELCC